MSNASVSEDLFILQSIEVVHLIFLRQQNVMALAEKFSQEDFNAKIAFLADMFDCLNLSMQGAGFTVINHAAKVAAYQILNLWGSFVKNDLFCFICFVADIQLVSVLFYFLYELQSCIRLVNLSNKRSACSAPNLELYCIVHVYPPFTRKRIVSLSFGQDVRTRMGVAIFEVSWPPVFYIKMGASRLVPRPRTQQANLPACSPQPPLNTEDQAGELWIPFLKHFGMIRQGE